MIFNSYVKLPEGILKTSAPRCKRQMTGVYWGELLFRSNQWKGEKNNLIPQNQRVGNSPGERISRGTTGDFQWQKNPRNSMKFSGICLNLVIFCWWNPPHFDRFHWKISWNWLLLVALPLRPVRPCPTCFRTLCAKTLPTPAPAVHVFLWKWGRPKPKNPLVDHGSWWFSLY